ncbi:hypothetical protein [Streptomyces sp. NPDC046909]|uniref:hypothetical protein n=1 Tax=Streptomyces sp. NPDC046909 TaxID=3155617 RepID=UPI00340CA8B8
MRIPDIHLGLRCAVPEPAHRPSPSGSLSSLRSGNCRIPAASRGPRSGRSPDQHAERILAYLFITHDLAVVKEFAARTLVLQHGRIVEEGPSTDVCDRPRHEYTRRLVAAPVPDPQAQRARRQRRMALEAAS